MINSFNKHDHVTYGISGVCVIEDICELAFDKKSPKKKYYILKPLNNTSVIYVPFDNDDLTQKMKYLLSSQEINVLLDEIKNKKMNWIDDKKERNECFNNVIIKKDQKELILLANCLYQKKAELNEINKALSVTDDKILKTTEKLIVEEFACSLKLNGEEVVKYIKEKLNLD